MPDREAPTTATQSGPKRDDVFTLCRTSDSLRVTWYTPDNATSSHNITAKDIPKLALACENAFFLVNSALPLPEADSQSQSPGGSDASIERDQRKARLAGQSVQSSMSTQRGLASTPLPYSQLAYGPEGYQKTLEVTISKSIAPISSSASKGPNGIQMHIEPEPLNGAARPDLSSEATLSTIPGPTAQHEAALFIGRNIQRQEALENPVFLLHHDQQHWRDLDAPLSPWRPDDDGLHRDLKQRAETAAQQRHQPTDNSP